MKYKIELGIMFGNEQTNREFIHVKTIECEDAEDAKRTIYVVSHLTFELEELLYGETDKRTWLLNDNIGMRIHKVIS